MLLGLIAGCAEGEQVQSIGTGAMVVFDAAPGMPDVGVDPGVCGPGLKRCGTACTPAVASVNGCANGPCTPCPSMAGYVSTCDVAGQCALECSGADCGAAGAGGAPGSGGSQEPAAGGAATGSGGADPGSGGAPLTDAGAGASAGGSVAPMDSGAGGMPPAAGGAAGSGGAPSACPGYPTDNACAQCICTECPSQIDACVNSGQTARDQACLAIRQCSDANSCTGAVCLCGDTEGLACVDGANGPCIGEIQAAAGTDDVIQINSQLSDQSTAVGRSANVSTCASAACAAACGYPN